MDYQQQSNNNNSQQTSTVFNQQNPFSSKFSTDNLFSPTDSQKQRMKMADNPFITQNPFRQNQQKQLSAQPQRQENYSGNPDRMMMGSAGRNYGEQNLMSHFNNMNNAHLSPITNNSINSMFNNQHTGAISRRENQNLVEMGATNRGGIEGADRSYLLNTIHNDNLGNQPISVLKNKDQQNGKINYPLTTGRKAQGYKSILNSEISQNNNQNRDFFSRKLFSPQDSAHHTGGMMAGSISQANQILSAGKSNEKLMDRFIPCRMGENLQAKFEAVSQKKEDEIKYNHQRASQLANSLGLDNDVEMGASGNNSANNQDQSMTSVNPSSNNNSNNVQQRQYSNIFGGVSTLDQINGFIQPPNSNQGTNMGAGQGRDDSHNLHNYNNLLEQQIFNGSDQSDTDPVQDSGRNLSIFNNQNQEFMRSFKVHKENQDVNIQPDANHSSSMSQGNNNQANQSLLNSKLFKFKKNTQSVVRKFGDNLATHPFTSLINLEPDQQQSPVELSVQRKISTQPYKVLDAPNLNDDFYLNLVDWSASNILAVALGQSVYIWNACTSRVSLLCDFGQNHTVTSVSWSQKGSHLCIGNNFGEIKIWDINQQKEVRSIGGHSNRVGSSSWNGSVIATGSRDRTILIRDVRAKQTLHQKLIGHKQEVCGLKWSFHDENQLASGGNDNKLFIWQPQSTPEPAAKFSQHKAAVKAIGWNPLQRGLLATGGGTADQCIRFWNTLTLQPINFINTGSQVCNLMFSKTNDELVSTHGYSLNQVIVWKYPSMDKIATLTGHTFRVLYLSMSPDGSSIVTGAGDETLRFWNVFPKSRSCQGTIGGTGVIGNGNSALFPSNIDFR